jgi:hypothetical protein
MYVQFMLPQAQNGKKHVPIGIVHGCCLSTKSWQTTPDGRMGWDEYFVRQGFDTYMIDQVSRARSGFDATSYQNVRFGVTPCVAVGTVTCPQNPNILIATDQFAWNIFRWGTAPCTGVAMLHHDHPSSGDPLPDEHRRCGDKCKPAILQHGHPGPECNFIWSAQSN